MWYEIQWNLTCSSSFSLSLYPFPFPSLETRMNISFQYFQPAQFFLNYGSNSFWVEVLQYQSFAIFFLFFSHFLSLSLSDEEDILFYPSIYLLHFSYIFFFIFLSFSLTSFLLSLLLSFQSQSNQPIGMAIKTCVYVVRDHNQMTTSVSTFFSLSLFFLSFPLPPFSLSSFAFVLLYFFSSSS